MWNPRYFVLKDNATSSGTQTWCYRDTVPPTDIDTAGYLADAGKRGVRIGDRLEYLQVDNQDDPTTIIAASDHVFRTANPVTGAADVADLRAFTVTNTD